MKAGAPARLAVFISGGGRTLRNLHDRCGDKQLDAEVALVIASRECPGAAWARGAGIETRVVPSALLTAPLLLNLFKTVRIDLCVLAGFVHLVPVPRGWERRIVNIHPALLPAHGGKGMHGMQVHRAVLAANESVSGATVHYCSDQYDQGPIIDQETCPVLPGDTPESLADRVFQVELGLYPRAIAKALTAIAR